MNFVQQMLIPMDLLTPGEETRLPKLYSRDNKGTIKVWEIRVTEIVGGYSVVTEWATFGGKVQSDFYNITEGKNIGKTNETTPFEQAMSEAQATWTKQRVRKGYYSLDDLNIVKAEIGYIANGEPYFDLKKVLLAMLPMSGKTVENYTRPMLAQKYWKKLKDGLTINVQFPTLGQPKINGVRCTTKYENGRVTLYSREGTIYHVGHIEHELACWYNDNPLLVDVIFDGELYIQGEFVATIAGAVKSPNLLTPRVEYHIFDVVDYEALQNARLQLLKSCLVESPLYPHLKRVKIKIIKTVQEADEFRDTCIAEGYEGGIFRHPLGKYEPGKRSKWLVKYKAKESGEFLIKDVFAGPKAPDLAIFLCRNDINHELFEVVPEGTHELRREHLINRDNLIGKLLTVEYYERSKPGDVPFNATAVAVRDYE